MQDEYKFTQLPLLSLTFDSKLNENRIEEDDVAFLLTSLLAQRTPTSPLNPMTNNNNNQLVQRTEPNSLAARILEGGSISIALMQVSSRFYQLIVDVSGVPLIGSVAVLKSLIIDSWIVGSNTLASLAGRSHPKEAILRALIMLLAKRFIGIKQLGVVREIVVLFSFIKLAEAAMRATNFHEELVPTLKEIASLPYLFYTALARFVVDNSATAKRWLSTVPDSMVSKSVNFRIEDNVKGQIGKNCDTLKASLEETLKYNPELKAYVRKHALQNPNQIKSSLSEFASVLSA